LVTKRGSSTSDWLALARESYPEANLVERAYNTLADLGLSVSAETRRHVRRHLFGHQGGFLHLPIAQAMEWGVVSRQVLDRFADSCALANLSFLLEDDLIDGAMPPGEACIVSQAALLATLSTLEEVTGQSFTTRFLARYVSYHKVWLAESSRQIDGSPEGIERLGDKAAPVFVGLEAAAAISERTLHAKIFSAIRYLCAALQLCDDLTDIEDDLTADRPSSITALFHASGGRDLRASDYNCDGSFTDHARDLIYISGTAMAGMRLASSFLSASSSSFAIGESLVGQQLAGIFLERVNQRITGLQSLDEALRADRAGRKQKQSLP
jgi:hypothetical protein